MASIALDRVTKVFPGGAPALEELTLDIKDHEFVSLVGPSGCGKSTTLNLVAGLEAPTRGTVRIGDRVVNQTSPGDRDVALVFQSYALYPHMTVADNIAFPLKVAKMGKSDRLARAQKTAERLGIEALLRRKPGELSGGQRQRVALARALVRQPKAFLFDEPLSNLDPGLRTKTRTEIKALHQELGTTFVYVTHDQSEAMTLSDRVAVLNRGVLQQFGSPREVYERPQNLFVANFFGTPAINVASPSFWTGRAPASEDATELWGLRSEHLALGLSLPPQGALTGTVRVSEPVGAETFVTVEIHSRDVIARAPAFFDGKPGQPAWVLPNLQQVHRFATGSKQRMA